MSALLVAGPLANKPGRVALFDVCVHVAPIMTTSPLFLASVVEDESFS